MRDCTQVETNKKVAELDETLFRTINKRSNASVSEDRSNNVCHQSTF